jgi:hypothetical protein
VGFTKRILEAQAADINRELRLCAVCGEQADYDALHYQFQHSRNGSFTTVWHCGCSDLRGETCARCGRFADGAPIALCPPCLEAYQRGITAALTRLECSRCGGEIPPGEVEVYQEEGLCGWCSHQAGRDSDPPALLAMFHPEHHLRIEGERRILLADALSRHVALVTDTRVIQGLFENPEHLFSISPREFEAFVAQLLENLGYTVRLGPNGADGGVDIYAEQRLPTGVELLLAQCKRNAPQNKVGLPVVKQFHTEVMDRQASRGLIVTTSSLTRPAESYIDEKRYRLSSADFPKLEEWMQRLRSSYA